MALEYHVPAHPRRRSPSCTRVANLVVLAALGLVPTAKAQEAAAHDHGLGQLGRVTFPVSCTPEARRRFERAMAVLHSFWWEEGDRAFGAVLEADSSCSMAHWGRALNVWGNPFAGGPSGAALRQGAEMAARGAARPLRTPREQGFVNAVAALYRGATTATNAAGLQSYADTMARLHRELPEDLEVTIYFALALLATAPRTDTTFAQQKRAVGLLDPLYAAHPDHPGLAHYIIHSTDSPRLAAHGLNAARRYARIAPSAPHAHHMPSHIFVRLGLWDETIAANWRSFDAGMAHARATKAEGVSGSELHALDYAVYGYLQHGQDSAARHAVATGQALEIAPARNNLVSQYNRTAMAARISLERGDWATAASFPPPVPPEIGVAAVLARFTRALGAARSGRLQAARTEAKALGAIAGALEARQEAYWSRVAGIKRDAASAWILFESGDTAAGLALAATAADTEEITDKHPVTPAELLPARELQADMLLAAGRYAEARAAYRATLVRDPGRARSLFGAARAAQLAGDRRGARDGYAEYVKAMARSDGARSEVTLARTFLRRR
jgi:tetratricopeptide (TPR) repeat protein